VRVGVIGTGFGQRVVAPAFAAAGWEVVDVVSARDADVAALASRVDLVSVHSPPFLHAEHVRAAVAQGKGVLCDKPLTLTEADVTAAGPHSYCNFEFRFSPARQRLRALVQTGQLGRIEHVQWAHMSSGSRVPLRKWGWLFDKDRGGGWIGAWASHAVDTLRWMFGEVVDVQSSPRIDIRERSDEQGVLHTCTAEDGLTAALTLDSGATVAIDSSFAAAKTILPTIVVFGSDDVAELVNDGRLIVFGADHNEDFAGEVEHHAVPMQRFAEEVRAAMSGEQPNADLPTFADGLACDRVLARLRTPQE
jgi:predicted dehydrogenase